MALEQLEGIESALGPRYVLKGELGRGRVAAVYLADDRKLERAVAIKVIRDEVVASVHAQRFLREIGITAKLRHPHILPLLDSGEVRGNPFYVTPYVAGGSLRDLMSREGALQVDRVVAITREVADALDYAHAHGVVHRDIKPENILFDDGHAVIADFGIALALTSDVDGRLTETGVSLGTPMYMSPEQAGGDRTDTRTDIYSLGCVAYEMLAGEPPFTGATVHAVIARHLNEPVPSLRVLRPTALPATQRMLEKALAKVPADRFATSGEFARALAASMQERSYVVRRLAIAALVVLSLIGAGIAARQIVYSGTGTTRAGPALDQRRIGVLYFEDLSPQKSLGHVATGLTEDLIDRLSQVRSLSVVSPNGVRAYQGKSPPIDSLAKALNVGTIVSGNVSRVGAALRLSVRLIDGATGRQIDSWTIDQSAQDQLTLQQRLVSKLTVSLRERIDLEIASNVRKSETKSVIAWETLMQAEDLLRRGLAAIREHRSEVADELLQGSDSLAARAARLDPAWAAPVVHRGRVALAHAYVGTRGEKWIRDAISFGDEALRREPRSADALSLRGEGRWRLATRLGDSSAATLLPLAQADLQAALQDRPDFARAWKALSDLYWREARFAEAATAARRALDADAFLPNLGSVVSMLFSASLESGRFDDASFWCTRAHQEYPGDPQLADCRLTLLGYTAQGADAVNSAWRALFQTEAADSLHVMEVTWGYRRMLVAAVLARTGGSFSDSARAVIRRTRVLAVQHPRSSDVSDAEAYVHVLLGENDEALQILEKSLRSDLDRNYAARSILFRSLQDDPRFQRLVETSTR